MKITKLATFIFLFLFISCGTLTKRGCRIVAEPMIERQVKKKVSETAAKRVAERQARKVLLKKVLAKGSRKDIIAIQQNKIKNIINPPLDIFDPTLDELIGTTTSKAVLKNAPIELKILNSSGKQVSTIPIPDKLKLHNYIRNEYKQIYISVIDEVFMDISKKEIKSSTILHKEILKKVELIIGEKRYLDFNTKEGILTSTIKRFGYSGDIKIIDVIKDGVIIGGGGHYIIKEIINKKK